MYGFTSDAVISILRHLLTFIGGLIVARGWISADIAAELTGAIVTIVSALYAIFFHATSNGTIPTQSVSTNANTNVTTTTITSAPHPEIVAP